MNEIRNVNLGGYPFTIDIDAHEQIKRYLKAIERRFADSDGCDEILDDIEARMAELFMEFLQGKGIISMKELDAVIKVMGRPEDFGAEPYDDEYEEEYQESRSSSFKDRYRHIKTGKRFFRDPEEKVIGGVCGGIAAYFGIENPMWIRLIFLALIFFAGIPILIYPILWAIVPEAKTAGDKLKMRGEPATVTNIARTVEEELNELSDKITEISKDLGSKKKSLDRDPFRREEPYRKGFL
ncbi:MAG: PspC domain-containing protein [Saprospiraceae bacterium]|nr:PspC domain-containing protein [Saprospiraceae bacterium]